MGTGAMQTENFAQVASQCQSMLGQAPYCGDGVWTHWHRQGLFGLLCDGAGHGVQAEKIQQQAIKVVQHLVETSEVIDLVALFYSLHQALKRTRGMVAVAFVLHKNGNMEFIHIGDVSLFCTQTCSVVKFRSIEQPGIIGYHMPTPRVQQWQFQPGQWLVMHSDGIRRSTTNDQWQRLLQPGHSLQTILPNILYELADGRDDAACIVMHYLGVPQVISLAGKPSGEKI